ncbi:hypothetical protein [Dinghuibacter silviterrae]|uniref:3-keto-disaccharide hydrolase domain-containing protein n=1 Tax=Dinghuibacter silviterrae TaxID=1539049 RepID=A0A4R8DI49_9BACT|nr:hypothetical protein [Dinghuibacter silviterrae]TDW97419.1 hypothetical protein EDB95_5268 [Dinghuibacter silviterrae]
MTPKHWAFIFLTSVTMSAAAQQQPQGYTRVNRTLSAVTGFVHMNELPGDGVAWINGKTWTGGTLECDIRGKDAFQQSFVGIAFHGANDSTFEVVYLRPFNFRSADTLRKKHAIQYIALPRFDWDTLRRTFPGKFEQPVTPAPDPNDWVHLKIIVKGKRIEAFVNGATKAALVVTSLAEMRGTKVGFWVGNGSGGDFKNLKLLY